MRAFGNHNDTQRSKKKLLIIVAVALVVIAVAAFLVFKFVVKDSGTASNFVTYPSEEFDYPAAWATRPVNQKEKDAGVISKLTHQDPLVDVVIRKQEASTEQNRDLQASVDNVAAALESEVEGLEVSDKKVIKVENKDVLEIHYSVENEDVTVHNRMFIVPLPSGTHYIIYKTETDELDKLKTDIDAINANYIKHVE